MATFLKREPTLVPLDRPVAEAFAVAKRELKPGETLDDFGGYTFYGLMDRADLAMKEKALPLGLAPGAKMRKPVLKGETITWDAVELDETSTVVKLRRQQDARSALEHPEHE